MQPRLRLLISGVLAAIIFGAGYCVAVVVPGAGDTTTNDYTSFYASDSRMTTAAILFFALIAGSVLMLWFFTELRAQLPDGLLTRIGYSAAMVGVVALPVGAAILGGPAGAQQGEGTAFVGVPVAAAFSQAGLGVMLGIGMVGFAVATLLMSLAARRTALFPQWLVVLGSVFGVLSIASYFWIPGFAFVAWVLITGVTLGTRSELSEAPAAALVRQGGRA
jgi:hypothetical protein